MIGFTYSNGSLVLTLRGNPFSLDKSHPKFAEILESLRAHTSCPVPCDEDVLWDLVHAPTQAIRAITEEDIVLEHGVVYVGNEPLHNSLTQRMLEMARMSLPIEGLKRFLCNLQKNPREEAKTELFDFLDNGGFPLTADGCFLGYRGVREDFRDRHSGKMDNSPGQVLEMSRENVCADPTLGCAPGLHVGTLEYAKNWGEKVVLVKVNPADAVSVPVHETSKLRVCKFEVIRVYEEDDVIPEPYVELEHACDDETCEADEPKDHGLFCLTKKELARKAVDEGLFRNFTEARALDKDSLVDALENLEVDWAGLSTSTLAKVCVMRKLFSSETAGLKRGRAKMIARLEKSKTLPHG